MHACVHICMHSYSNHLYINTYIHAGLCCTEMNIYIYIHIHVIYIYIYMYVYLQLMMISGLRAVVSVAGKLACRWRPAFMVWSFLFPGRGCFGCLVQAANFRMKS